jgi:uncharacterized membrane protein
MGTLPVTNLRSSTLLLPLAIAAHAAAAELTIIPATGGYMTGVSGDGSVVVGYGAQYFYWTKATGSIFIGGIPPGIQGAGGSAQISTDGTRLCGNVLNDLGKVEAATYDIAAGAWQTIGTLGSNCDINSSTAWGISGDGRTVVGGVYPSFCTHRAMKWSEGGTMGTLFSWFGWTTRANGTNADGSLVFGWQDIDTGFRQGCFWVNGVQTRLASPTGVRMGEAQCSTDDGSVVFGFGDFNDGQGRVPFRWTAASKAVPLGPDPELAPGYATGCSADGSVVSCFFRWGPPAVSGEGYAWIQGRGFVALEVLAVENGIAVPDGLRLSLPLDVSADGKTIVGAGRDAVGQQVIFVLDLHPASAPCTADVNFDGTVDGLDLGLLLGNWGQSGVGDIDNDGVVTGFDLGALLGQWGPCP